MTQGQIATILIKIFFIVLSGAAILAFFMGTKLKIQSSKNKPEAIVLNRKAKMYIIQGVIILLVIILLILLMLYTAQKLAIQSGPVWLPPLENKR